MLQSYVTPRYLFICLIALFVEQFKFCFFFFCFFLGGGGEGFVLKIQAKKATAANLRIHAQAVFSSFYSVAVVFCNEIH